MLKTLLCYEAVLIIKALYQTVNLHEASVAGFSVKFDATGTITE